MAFAKKKILVVMCSLASDVLKVDALAHPHASDALAYLEGGGQ